MCGCWGDRPQIDLMSANFDQFGPELASFGPSRPRSAIVCRNRPLLVDIGQQGFNGCSTSAMIWPTSARISATDGVAPEHGSIAVVGAWSHRVASAGRPAGAAQGGPHHRPKPRTQASPGACKDLAFAPRPPRPGPGHLSATEDPSTAPELLKLSTALDSCRPALHYDAPGLAGGDYGRQIEVSRNLRGSCGKVFGHPATLSCWASLSAARHALALPNRVSRSSRWRPNSGWPMRLAVDRVRACVSGPCA